MPSAAVPAMPLHLRIENLSKTYSKDRLRQTPGALSRETSWRLSVA